MRIVIENLFSLSLSLSLSGREQASLRKADFQQQITVLTYSIIYNNEVNNISCICYINNNTFKYMYTNGLDVVIHRNTV